MKVGFIGGTGNQGQALAKRFAQGGIDVILGSRSMDKAEKVAKSIYEQRGLRIRAATNEEAAEKADMVILTLPHRSMKETMYPLKERLRDKIVVDVINPTSEDHSSGVSASEELQAILPDSKIVCAFKNVSSKLMDNAGKRVEVDSIVCSDDQDAKKRVMELSEKIGIPSVDGGGIKNALTCEMLTRLLLDINRRTEGETGIKVVHFKV